MPNVRVVFAAVSPSFLLLAGCLAPRPPLPPSPPPPTSARAAPPTSARAAPPTRCAPGAVCAPTEASPHRQYYDVRRRRYYYFDPAKGAYFWEDGSPKL